ADLPPSRRPRHGGGGGHASIVRRGTRAGARGDDPDPRWLSGAARWRRRAASGLAVTQGARPAEDPHCPPRRPGPRTLLCEFLWPETDPDRAGNRLSVAISTLRQVLDRSHAFPSDHYVASGEGAVRLRLEH